MPRVLVKDTNPVGVVLPFSGSASPTGWLLCNGAAVSRTVYAGLFAVIGTTYGNGDGSTTFNLPNTSGIFLRGQGSQTVSGVSYNSGALGAKVADQMQGHTHNIPDTGGTMSNGSLGTKIWRGLSTTQEGGAYANTTPVTDGSNGTPRTGTQTHPANLVVNYIIKV